MVFKMTNKNEEDAMFIIMIIILLTGIILMTIVKKSETKHESDQGFENVVQEFKPL